MTTRRRWIARLILALLVSAFVVAWFGLGGGNPEVRLMFLRYTNVPMIVVSSEPNSQASTQIWTQVLLLATNVGAVPARFVRVWKMEDPPLAHANLDNDIWGMPAVLKPGESEIAAAFWPTGQSRCRATIALRRDGFMDRLADKLGKRGFDRLQKAVAPSPFSDAVCWFYSDWLTNLPAASNARLPFAP